MSKYLKKYNEETQEWELVSSPDVNVEQKLEDGSDITDSNVIVKNEYFAKGDSGKTLYDAFTDLGGDIRKLQRNVSWLAEFGGGGSGGGGSTSSFGIEIISPAVENGVAYVSEKVFDIEFMITGGTPGDPCTYSYSYDSSLVTDPKPIGTNESVKIHIDNTASSAKDHSIIIYATNPYNVSILPKSIKIYESTLTLAFDAATAGPNYENGVLKVSQNDPDGWVPFILANGLLESNTVLQADYNGRIETLEFVNKTTEPQTIKMRLWKILPEVETNTYYVINFKATANVSSIGTTVESETVPVRIRVISPSEITVSMGINGESGNEAIRVALSSMMNYNFKVYGPASVTSVYYSAKIVNGENEQLVLGQYYDDDLHAEGSESYTSNTLTYIETTISSQWYMSTDFFSLEDSPKLYIKAWNVDGILSGESYMSMYMVESTNETFPRQYSTRGGAGDTAHTMFASWNAYNATSINPKKWDSQVEGYSFLDGILSQSEEGKVNLSLNIQNGNDSSGIITETFPPYMRIQNKAYATIDFTKYANELVAMTNMRTGGNPDGFTISVCANSDEHSDNQHTLFLWGINDANGELNSGIRIDINKAQWRIGDAILSCPISYGTRNMIDFSYVRNGDVGTARIYLNGVLNVAKDIKTSDFSMQIPTTAYIGVNYRNGVLERFSDFNLYEISIYTKSLNDLQLVVNSKNARFTNIADYNDWKIKNFISSTEEEPSVPVSVFFNNGTYIKNFSTTVINDIARRSSIPTLSLFFETGSGFKEDFFYKKYDTDVTNLKFDATAEYYDLSSSNEAVRFSAKVSLQGTTTLGYRVKNLELYVNEMTTVKGVEMVKLFQPKKEWFPESQFTLKADVVDSAHANNAVLGEWINSCGIMEDNPAMFNFNDNTRPKDVDDEGTIHTHIKPGTTTVVDCDEDVTIKHTLEGFPILLFIYFDGGQAYNFIGIYSFNLGRHSYYNMGMKFLKNFSRRGANNEKVACPKIINYYEEMETLGTVSSSDVYSFEFGNDGNLRVADYPVWSQYNQSVVQSYGEFKYPSVDTSNAIWGKLCSLFQSIAQFKITKYYDDFITIYDNIYPYTIDSQGNYVQDGTTYILQNNVSNAEILSRICTGNTVAYFVIANAFGMTDSLGKNMTLRTWDGGNFWYPCFYDMDSALAIENDGTQNNAVDISIDKIQMETVGGNTNVLKTTYHDPNSRYAAYLSKLWGVFRDSQYIYNNQSNNPYYEQVWAELRKSGGKLSTYSKFTNLMSERVDTCGEMIYDYDYNMKYIQDAEDTSGTESSINFLHGTRIEFVKDWLKRHLYYLDGVFDVNRLSGSYTFEDSPYYSDIANIGVTYPETIRTIAYNVQVSTPTFLGLSVGNAPAKKYYLSTPNTDTILYYVNASSSSSQLTINGSTLITKMDGFQGGFRTNKIAGVTGSLKSLSEFNASNSSILVNDPLSTKDFILNGNSALEAVDLSSTRGANALETYDVDLSDFTKVLSINIANSDVTSIKLPKSTLQYLNITNSNLRSFVMENQNNISSINFDGCNNLSSIRIVDCSTLQSLAIEDKINISTVLIYNCQSLDSITIKNCPALTSVEIANNASLKNVDIENCENYNLSVKIYGSKLNRLYLSNLSETTQALILPDKNDMSQVTSLTISNCYKISGIHYTNSEIERYKEEEVFDLSPLTNLSGENLILRNINGLKYLRVRNDDGETPVTPINLYNDTFYGCKNLERVFGYISIVRSPFSNLNKFKLNEDDFMPSDGMPEVPFVLTTVDPYYTNVKISSTNLSGWFSRTSCDIHDVYYILQLCDNSIVSLENLFSNCANVITSDDEPLDKDIFSKLAGENVSVTNIDGILHGCDISGLIDQETFPVNLMKKITKFNNVLSGKYSFDSDTTIFPEGNEIKTLVGFNPYQSAFFRDTALLTTLTKLEVLEDCFNDCGIDFESGGYMDARELFKYNTKLIKIANSFRNLVDCNGSIKNIFGGEIEDEDGIYYPRQLSSITNSFTFITGSHNPDEMPLFDGDEGELGIAFPLGNSFLSKIADSIVYITGGHPGENKTYSQDYMSSDMPCFSGPGIIKYIDDIDMGTEYMKDDCDGKHFPYKILKGCTKLKEFPNLFENLQNFTRDENDNIVPITVNILEDEDGHSIFEDCISLENVSKMFYNMASKPESGKIYAKLNGKAFKNCKIKNAELIFSTKNTGRYEIIDMLPYGLFYQEKEELYPKQSGLTESQASAYGITDDSGTLSELNDYTVFSGTYKAINSTIKHMPSCLSNLKSSTLKPYTANIITYEDVTEDNPNYNPLKYLLNGLEYTINPDYNKYKKIWNKYVFDGSEDFYRYFVRSDEKYIGIFEIIDEYGNPIVNENEMPVQFTQGYIDANNVENFLDSRDIGSDDSYGRVTSAQIKHNIFGIRNYFCPPDIFRYCEDTARTNIDNAFAGSSDDYNDSISDNYGLRGTIPEFIFEPLSNIQGMSGVFVSFKMLLPYKWRKVDGGITTEYGVTYPPMLFSGLTNTFSITSIFSDTRIWGNTIIPSDLFTSPSIELSDISGMWSSAKWIDRVIQQLPSDILYSCRYLRNISGMLADSGNLSIYFITSNLVTVLRNSYLNNCTKFLYQATSTTGSVPELWNWPSTQLTNYYYALKGVNDGSRITNYDAAKFEKFVRDM